MFTAKMEGMLKDVAMSKDIGISFKQVHDPLLPSVSQ
jgi:hypothetical protein